jgi:uncharacterized protein YecE (DUF72 family)
MTPLLVATAEATEEAIYNSLLRAETVQGRDGHVAERVPIDRVRPPPRPPLRLARAERRSSRGGALDPCAQLRLHPRVELCDTGAMSITGYHLGCPAWGMKSWVGRLFPKGTKQADFLACYSRVFNTVEGNTTFYALPKVDSVARWNADTPADFRFCFKFPKKITHEKLLEDSTPYVEGFLKRVEPLGDKLGTLMIQLPPRFGFKQLERLGSFIDALPRDFSYAVELRHKVFFNGHDEERAAVDLLAERNVDIVIMDARGLHATDNPALDEVRKRKPNLPIVMRATGPQPVVRVVPHDRFDDGITFVAPWIDQIARWIGEGKKPYFFMHAPDDTFAPANAYRFHELLSERVDAGTLPPWPGDSQLGLF